MLKGILFKNLSIVALPMKKWQPRSFTRAEHASWQKNTEKTTRNVQAYIAQSPKYILF